MGKCPHVKSSACEISWTPMVFFLKSGKKLESTDTGKHGLKYPLIYCKNFVNVTMYPHIAQQ
jgi:hypothetical protein